MHPPNFAIIVATDTRNGIGKNNQLPWHLSSDLKQFKTITSSTQNPNKQNAVIMGRKSWESLPPQVRPLPGRHNIVLSQNPNNWPDIKVPCYPSLDNALRQLPKHIESVFIIGGAQIYASAIQHPNCQTLYITRIQKPFDCDVFFPEIPPQFQLDNQSEDKMENDIPFRFEVYKRKN